MFLGRLNGIALNPAEQKEHPLICLEHATAVGVSGAIVDASSKLVGCYSANRAMLDRLGSLEKHKLLSRYNLIWKRFSKGRLAVATATSADHNYFHWMLDLVPRLIDLQRSRELWDQVLISYAKDILPFQQETLDLLGVDQDRRIRATRRQCWTAACLVVPALPDSFAKVQPQVVMQVRQAFARLLKKVEGFEKILICRQKGHPRSFSNHDEVVDFFESLGYKKIYLEDYSVAEQAAIFYSAQKVVAVHGAGLTNLVFSHPEQAVVEIFGEDYQPRCFEEIATILGLNYQKIVFPYSSQALCVDVDQLKKAIAHD
ncbi:glycosyltransferase family 61 protein [Marinospirillum sp. MEB164]|uniref:Glycosyltransferase family 61 protein n=1 Tax=Marinospirillum alkalitolerans TaxID=3123374 RepID=A0ABW8Q018_9GAMM